MRVPAALLTALLLVTGTACTGADPDTQTAPEAPEPTAGLEPMEPFGTTEIALVAPDGQRTPMPVYVADRPETRRQGLMGVTDLPWEAGMVFLYEEDREGGFWMKDTLIPLSIAFFDAGGQVLAVLDMEPCEADPCPSYDPEVTYRGALEVNQGRFDELGLDQSGWHVDLTG